MFIFLSKVVGFAFTLALIVCGWAFILYGILPNIKLHSSVLSILGVIICLGSGVIIYWVGSLVVVDIKKSYGR
jgi:hypothetical protein